MPDFSKVWASNSPLPAYTFTDADYLTGWDFVGSAPPTKNEFDAWFKMVDEKLNYLYGQLQTTASKLYPVGSVYISFSATDPSTLFGGTWARLKDRMLMASGDAYAPNTTGGSATKTIAVSNLPAHNHTVNSAGTHTHTASTGASGVHNHSVSGSNSDAGKHTHTITASASTVSNHKHDRGNMNITGTFFADNIGSAYNTGAFAFTGSNVTPGIVDNDDAPSRVIDFNASKTWTGETSANGSHTHTITATASQVANHTHTWSGSVANNGSHTHTVTVANNGSHTHTTNNTGSGTPLNIMPPYQTVYMWRRTA